MPAMKITALLSTLIIGSALTLSACGKDKKPATTATDPAAAPADPAAAAADPAAPAAEAPKPEEKPATGGGW